MSLRCGDVQPFGRQFCPSALRLMVDNNLVNRRVLIYPELAQRWLAPSPCDTRCEPLA